VGAAKIQVGTATRLLGRRADGGDDREAGREVRGPDAGLQTAEQVRPAVQRLAGDLLSRERVHHLMLAQTPDIEKDALRCPSDVSHPGGTP
jgi:hypothetical protein